jgi:lipopolysaccharide export system permease protein
MSLLTRYLMRTILVGTALVLLVLLALAGLFEFIAQLEDVQRGYQIPQALTYALLRLPQLSFEMLPIATLIGALLGLGGLANNSELVVMRTAGLSIRRLAGMVAWTGLVIMIFTALIGEFIGPPLDYFARTMRNELRLEQENRNLGKAAWVKDGPVIFHLEHVNSDFEFGGVYLFRFNEDNSLRAIGRAENSVLDESDNWRLENFRETQFEDDGVQVVQTSMAVESFGIDSEMLGVTLVKPISLSASGLLAYIRYLKKNGLAADRYESELWSRVSSTATVVIMPVLALAFVFGSLRSAGSGTRLMLGVMLGLGYFLASEMTANSGVVFGLNPAILTWLPSIALLLVMLFALSRVR